MSGFHRFLAVALIGLLPGCATVFDGSTQGIAVLTEPPGALCAVDRGRTAVGRIERTPGIVRFEKSKEDISISCVKDGYGAVTSVVSSRFTGITFANFMLGFNAVGTASFLVDAATGSNWTYSSPVTLRMTPGPSLPVRRVAPLDAYGSTAP